MIDHGRKCNGDPCTCGAQPKRAECRRLEKEQRARARDATRRFHEKHPRMAHSEPIQANITADRLGIAEAQDGRMSHELPPLLVSGHWVID